MAETDPIPLSALQHYTFCPRQAALIHLEAAWSENIHTAQGRLEHRAVHEEKSRTKGGVRLARGLWLRSARLNLIGKADMVEFHKVKEGGCRLPNLRGRWQPFPVEYKKGRRRPEPGSLVQLCGQAICLEEMLQVGVPAGALFFGKSKRRLAVEFDPKLRTTTEAAAAEFHQLLAQGVTPPPRKEGKCEDCSLLDQCQPGPVRKKRRVDEYLAKALASSLEVDSKQLSRSRSRKAKKSNPGNIP